MTTATRASHMRRVTLRSERDRLASALSIAYIRVCRQSCMDRDQECRMLFYQLSDGQYEQYAGICER